MPPLLRDCGFGRNVSKRRNTPTSPKSRRNAKQPRTWRSRRARVAVPA